ncbi:MAG: PEGA domain-containing protein [Terriglobia bacterium]
MTIRNTLLRVGFAVGLILGTGFGVHAGNKILGEVRFEGWTKAEKLAGVWIDGQYVGYLGELKGSKKLLLMPGEHEVVFRQSGYIDVPYKFSLQPGERYTIKVLMDRDPKAVYPDQTATVKLRVSPNRAGVFVDGVFAGHVDEFDGPGQALLVGPGKHQIEIALPGYRPFRTEVNLLPGQDFKIETNLFQAPA